MTSEPHPEGDAGIYIENNNRIYMDTSMYGGSFLLSLESFADRTDQLPSA